VRLKAGDLVKEPALSVVVADQVAGRLVEDLDPLGTGGEWRPRLESGSVRVPAFAKLVQYPGMRAARSSSSALNSKSNPERRLGSCHVNTASVTAAMVAQNAES